MLAFSATSSHRRFWRVVWDLMVILSAASAFPSTAVAAMLLPETVKAWNRYYEWIDKRVDRELSDPNRFLVQDYFPPQEKTAIQRRLENSEIAIKSMRNLVPPDLQADVPYGEIHHWWGTVLVPNVTLPELLKFLEDYDHHAGKFADVEKSKLLSRDGPHFRIYFRLRRTKTFITACYNTEQEATYTYHDSKRASSRSVASKIAELENAGTPSEKEKTPGDDRGYLWRLVSWWRFQETPRGVIVELESASLSRNIPWVLKNAPLLGNYILSTPKESLESVLASVRKYAQSKPAE